jgi:hypothetical protein
MASEEFATYAWLLKGMTGSEAGWLDLTDGRLRFSTPDGVVFDVPLAEITDVEHPWYYFGGGVKLKAAGTAYRLSYVRPNGAEYAAARGLADLGSAASLALVASKVEDIGAGRDAGARWKTILERAGS